MTTIQLQVWNGKAYEPLETRDSDELSPRERYCYQSDNERLFPDIAELRRRRRAWRVVAIGLERQRDIRKDWPLTVPRLRKPRSGSAPNRTAKQVIDDYMTWALKTGLKSVTVYTSGYESQAAAKAAGLAYVEVDAADFIGPVTEEADEAAAA